MPLCRFFLSDSSKGGGRERGGLWEWRLWEPHQEDPVWDQTDQGEKILIRSESRRQNIHKVLLCIQSLILTFDLVGGVLFQMFKGPNQDIEAIFTAPVSAVCGVTLDTSGKKEYLISGLFYLWDIFTLANTESCVEWC